MIVEVIWNKYSSISNFAPPATKYPPTSGTQKQGTKKSTPASLMPRIREKRGHIFAMPAL